MSGSFITHMVCCNVSATPPKAFRECSHHDVNICWVHPQVITHTPPCFPNCTNAVGLVQIDVCLSVVCMCVCVCVCVWNWGQEWRLNKHMQLPLRCKRGKLCTPVSSPLSRSESSKFDFWMHTWWLKFQIQVNVNHSLRAPWTTELKTGVCVYVVSVFPLAQLQLV